MYFYSILPKLTRSMNDSPYMTLVACNMVAGRVGYACLLAHTQWMYRSRYHDGTGIMMELEL